MRARRVIVALTSALTLTACIGELPPPPAEGDAAPAGGAAPSAPVSVDPCPDLDGDGVAGCAGDCDDNAPWVSPERAERCNARHRNRERTSARRNRRELKKRL